MAKRAAKTAEDAADLDLVEQAIGEEPKGKPGPFDYALAYGAALFAIVLIMAAARLVFAPPSFGGDDVDPDARLAEVERIIDRANTFPDPRAVAHDPIVIEVTCPDGSVHVQTGPQPSDSVCVTGSVVEPGQQPEPSPTAEPFSQAASTALPAPPTQEPEQSTVGGTNVPPGLHCQEDEGIRFYGVPDTLGCVHNEEP